MPEKRDFDNGRKHGIEDVKKHGVDDEENMVLTMWGMWLLRMWETLGWRLEEHGVKDVRNMVLRM